MDEISRALLPATAAGIELVEDLELGPFREGLVKRATLVHFRRAEEKIYFAPSQVGVLCRAQGRERFLYPCGPAELVVAEKVRAFQPDQFGAAKKRERLQGLD